MKLTIKAI